MPWAGGVAAGDAPLQGSLVDANLDARRDSQAWQSIASQTKASPDPGDGATSRIMEEIGNLILEI